MIKILVIREIVNIIICYICFFLVLPFYKRCAHTRCNRSWISFIEFENTLDTGNFCRGCVHTTKSSPIIYNHTGSDYVAASIHSSGLEQNNHLQKWKIAESFVLPQVALAEEKTIHLAPE